MCSRAEEVDSLRAEVDIKKRKQQSLFYQQRTINYRLLPTSYTPALPAKLAVASLPPLLPHC